MTDRPDPLSRDRSAEDYGIEAEEPRVQLNVEIPKSLKDKLDAVAFFEDTTRVELVTEALERLVEEKESERGEPYPTR